MIISRIFGKADGDQELDLKKVGLAALGCFASIAILAYITIHSHLNLMLPSFGATALILFGMRSEKMSRMRNVIGGHLLSSIIGVGVYQLFGFTWWSISLGVTLALTVMLLTDTLHPPAGGTAFSAIMYRQQYVFIFKPVLLGAFLLVCLSLVFRFTSQIDLKHRCMKNEKSIREGKCLTADCSLSK